MGVILCTAEYAINVADRLFQLPFNYGAEYSLLHYQLVNGIDRCTELAYVLLNYIRVGECHLNFKWPKRQLCHVTGRLA